MKNNQDNSHANIDENSIDIIAVLKKLWVDRKFIIKASILFFFIGVVIALLSPVSYTSETTFVPQTSDQSSSSSSKGLGSLASLEGYYSDGKFIAFLMHVSSLYIPNRGH